jgi:uncharacterized protein YjbI with pentapeptide repeats
VADDDHIFQLRQGAASWNTWRDEAGVEFPDLSGADLREANLSEAMLIKANLSGAMLIKADLSGAMLIKADLSGANLSGANLSGAHLSEAMLIKADLSGAMLIKADLIEADLSGANLSGANLSGGSLVQANLSGANLVRANLSGGSLVQANLSGASLVRANLSGANLSRATVLKTNLGEANLSGANLSGANLSGANLILALAFRVDLFEADLSKADLSGASLFAANLSNADLSGANLSETNLRAANLLATDLTGADLTGCRIYGVSAWDVATDGETKQTGLIITPDDQPAVMVDDLQVAQFIYLLLDRKKIRNVIDTVTRKGVLLLGRFEDGGLALLQALAAWLRRPENGGYLPLLFDFPRPESKTYTDTIRTLASLARFVIVDLSGPSVPQEITTTVDLYEIPFVPVLDKKRKGWSMFKDFLVKERVLKPVRFTDQDHLLELLAEEVITPAEKLIEKRQQRLDAIFGRAPKKSSPRLKRG